MKKFMVLGSVNFYKRIMKNLNSCLACRIFNHLLVSNPCVHCTNPLPSSASIVVDKLKLPLKPGQIVLSHQSMP